MNHKLAFTLIALYIMMLSVIPLIGSLLALREWVGFDTGAYYYRSERLEVRFTGLPEGVGKPRIYIYMPNSSYKPILLLDVDDRESMVEGFSLFYDTRDVRIIPLNETLIVTYVFDDFNVSKHIAAYNDSVILELKATRESYFHIVFKGRNITSVNGIDVKTLEGRSVKLDNVTRVEFTFNNRLVGSGGGSLSFTKPVTVTISEDMEGITSINVEFRDVDMGVTVRGYIEPIRVSTLTHTISSILNHRVTPLLLPLIAMISIVVGWIIWRKLLD